MKHLIKIDTSQHGSLAVFHDGRDSQYCEAGEPVTIDWQPSSGWGLQEAHFITEGGNIVPIDTETRTFTMPDSAITVGATFKKFLVGDWTEGTKPNTNAPFVCGENGQPVTLGRYATGDLPQLDGMNAAGAIAFDTTTRKYVVWNGLYWTDFDGKPITPQYLKFTAQEVDSAIGFVVINDGYELPEDYSAPKLEYSTDGGETWNPYTLEISDTTEDANLIDLENVGDEILFRGVNENLSYYLEDDVDFLRLQAHIVGTLAAFGDVTSLLNGYGGDVPLATDCYAFMFQGCTGLTSAPSLPATTLATDCYAFMFQGCTGLTSAPSLPATTLATYCYQAMFQGCTGLTSAPSLPATTLAANCYQAMFQGCTHITSHDVATLNTSTNVFYSNSACETFTIHAATPPTIANTTITGLKATCRILVHADSVDAYKAKQYWSARADYIEAIPF